MEIINEIKKEPVYNRFFLIGYFIFLISTMCNKVIYIKPIMGLVFYTSIALMCWSILLSIYNVDMKKKIKNKKVLIYMIAIFLLFCVSYVITGNSRFIVVFFSIVACKNLDFRKFVKYDIIFKIAILAFVVLNFMLGATENANGYRATTLRLSMGFSHPNIFGFYIMIIYAEYLYLKKLKLEKYDIIVILSCVIIIHFLSASRTSTAMVVIMFLSALFVRPIVRILKKNENVRLILKNLFLILTIVSLLLGIAYKLGAIESINKWLAGRPRFINMFMEEYDVKILAQKVKFISSKESRKTWRGK